MMVKLNKECSNILLEMCSNFWNNECWLDEKELTITKEIISNEEEEYEEGLEELYPLIGYTFMVKQKGKHKHDGQLVDYIFKFKSPEEKVTKVKTQRALMLGWNFLGEIEIK